MPQISQKEIAVTATSGLTCYTGSGKGSLHWAKSEKLHGVLIINYTVVVNIWSGSIKLIKVVPRQNMFCFRTTLMKCFDPLQMLTSVYTVLQNN